MPSVLRCRLALNKRHLSPEEVFGRGKPSVPSIGAGATALTLSVGIFDGERMRAWHALNDMYQRRPFLETSDRVEFRAAYELLSKHLTREVAELAGDLASRRVEYLQIAEPPPHREDFLPARPPQPIQSPKVLAQVEQEFERAWHEHVSRESWRKREIEYAKSVYERVRAREIAEERAQRIEANRARWPADADLDDELLDIEDMSVQVDIQNDKIEERLAQLDNLLTYGLLDNPNTTATPTANPKGEPDPDKITHALMSRWH